MFQLGCGAALPSIVALKEGARAVCMQDFVSQPANRVRAIGKTNHSLKNDMGIPRSVSVSLSGLVCPSIG